MAMNTHLEMIVTQVEESIDAAEGFNRSLVTLRLCGQDRVNVDGHGQVGNVSAFEVKMPVRHRQGEPRPFRVGEKYCLQLNIVQTEQE